MSPPTIEQRIAATTKPHDRSPVMYQKWRDLLFAHWEFDPALLQETLPKGLIIDTYKGKAFLGVVPFFMQDIRPRFCPAVPGISNFMEMNLRTYVYDQKGCPGVWFYSLDANQWLAVKVARSFFHLPYFDAVMEAQRGEEIIYKVDRKGRNDERISKFHYTPREWISPPLPGSLEFFLIERYLLYSVDRSGALFSGQVSHPPYPLREVTAKIESIGVLSLAGFEPPGRRPDHLIFSPGVDVDIFSIQRAAN